MRMILLVLLGVLVVTAEFFSIHYLVRNLVCKRPFLLPTVLIAILVGMLLPFKVVDSFYLLNKDFGIYGIPFPEAVMKMEGGMWVEYVGLVSIALQSMNRILLFLTPQIIAALIYRKFYYAGEQVTAVDNA